MEDQLKMSSSSDMPEPKRQEVQTELIEIRKLLEKNEDILSKLHKENSKTFVFAVLIMFLCFLIYGIYVMMYSIPRWKTRNKL